MSIAENLRIIRERCALAAKRVGRDPAEVSLVAVSKRMPISFLHEAVTAEQLLFGESYLQEAVDKISELPGVVWHFIGRIQSNKAKTVAENFNIVETVDRLKIAKALEKHLAVLDKVMSVYLQVNIGLEPQKAGVMPEDLRQLAEKVAHYKHLRVVGLMAMPPYNPDPESSRGYFRQTRKLVEELADVGLLNGRGLSMGMSGDFEVAIEEGATLVRVGTAIFGQRT